MSERCGYCGEGKDAVNEMPEAWQCNDCEQWNKKARPMTTVTKDRDHYRAQSNKELLLEIQEAVPTHVDWQELAVVLAERLDKAEFAGGWENCHHCGSELG